MGKIMHCFLKNKKPLHSFLSRSFWKNRLWFQCRLWVFRMVWCYIEYLVNTSRHNTGIIRFSNDNYLLYWWGQLFVNGNCAWHIHTYTNGAIMSKPAMHEVQEPYWLSVAIAIAGKNGVQTPNFTLVRWRKLSSLQEVFSSSFFAQSNLHVFATIALPTPNST